VRVEVLQILAEAAVKHLHAIAHLNQRLALCAPGE
jgi:hypothetical protein